MSEYIDHLPEGYHIDGNFGREFDPYPGNRRQRQDSWVTSPGGPNSSMQITSPPPQVHRLTRGLEEDRFIPRDSLNFGPPLSGPSRFREMDQPNPARFTSPTNVSYPSIQSTHPGFPPRGDSSFAFSPRGSSTPAPHANGYGVRGPPGQYPTGGYGVRGSPGPAPEPRYGVADEGHSEGISGEPTPEYDQESVRDQERDTEREESLEAMSLVVDDYGYRPVVADPEMQSEVVEGRGKTQRPMVEPEMTHDVVQGKGKKKAFVGGFVSGLMNFPRKMHKGSTRPLHIVNGTPNTPTDRRAPAEASPSHEQNERPPLRRANSQPLAPLQTKLSAQLRTQSSARPLVQPVQPLDQDVSSSATSQTGPITPEQTMDIQTSSIGPTERMDMPIDLVNPHENSPLDIRSISTPEPADLRHTADYDAMDAPIYSERPETTFSSHINRVGKFFNDLTHLPWISTLVSVEYRPGESRRARYAGDKPAVSWYAKENHERLDLLAESRPVVRPRATLPPNAPQQRRHRPRTPPSSPASTDARRATAIRPSRTPVTLTSRGAGAPASPGASSHGQGQHSYSYSYYYPQPLYVYPSSASPRGGGLPEMAAIRMPGSPGGPDMQQAVPVYMLAPGPVVLPHSPGGHRRHHTSRPMQNPPSFPMPTHSAQSPTPPRSPPPRLQSPSL